MNKSIFFVMGVSGTGKTTIGTLLAQKLNFPFFDGDDYHPKENIKKMMTGNPLNDKDRHGWLKTLNQLAKKNSSKGAVIACSALKEKYRIQLSNTLKNQTVFVYLKGSYDEVKTRIDSRKNHYMSSKLLKSQFTALEVPDDAISVSIMKTPEQIVGEILKGLEND